MPELPEVSAPRARTRAALLQLIQRSEGLTRADLAAATGLSGSTVAHAVRALIDAGRVVETRAASKGPGSGSGRPGVRLRAVPLGRHVAGIDLGHTHVAVAVADETGAELAGDRIELDVDVDAAEALRAAGRLLREQLTRQGVDRVDGLVMGVPMPVDVRADRVRMPMVASMWSDLRLSQEAERWFGVPVHVENDALLGAYGELRCGAGKGLEDFLYVKVSHGVGAALVLGGAPYRGSRGLAGDIGHDRVPGRAELCRCGGRGCVEAVISLDSVRSQVLQTHPGLAADAAFDVVDEITERILTEAGRTLGRVLAPHANLLNPAGVVVGGVLAGVHPAFVDGVAWALRELGRPPVAETRVLVSTLGARAGVVGAVQAAADRLAARTR